MITFIVMLYVTVIWLESNKVFQFELTRREWFIMRAINFAILCFNFIQSSDKNDVDIWTHLPHMSWRQLSWLVFLSLNGFHSGCNYIFPVFAQYTPRYECVSANSSAGDSCDISTCVFDKAEYQPRIDYETIPTEFKLICNREWINSLTTALPIAAMMIGNGMTGWLSKRIDVRNLIIFSRVLSGIFLIGLSFANNIILVIILRSFSMLTETITILQYMLAIELVGPSYAR